MFFILKIGYAFFGTFVLFLVPEHYSGDKNEKCWLIYSTPPSLVALQQIPAFLLGLFSKENIYVNAKTHPPPNQSLNIDQQRRNTPFPETHISSQTFKAWIHGCFALSHRFNSPQTAQLVTLSLTILMMMMTKRTRMKIMTWGQWGRTMRTMRKMMTMTLREHPERVIQEHTCYLSQPSQPLVV